jgi:hypothetical protein
VKRTVFNVLAFGLLLSSTGQARADFLNHDVRVDYLYPDMNTVFQTLGTAPVNPVAHFNSFGQTNYDVSAANILITNSAGGDIFFLPASFNGVSVTGIGLTEPITGVTINPATNLAGFDASRVSSNADAVFVNLQSLTTTTTTVVSLDVQFAQPAPEPSSLTLLGIGTLGLLGYGWRRKRAAS